MMILLKKLDEEMENSLHKAYSKGLRVSALLC